MTAPRLGAGPRSLRFKLMALGLGMALLPLVGLAIVWTYEQALVARDLHRLRTAAAEASRTSDLHALGARLRLEIARLDSAGAILARSQTMDLALERSAVGWLGERLVGAAPAELLETADGARGDWAGRPEVQSALAGVSGWSADLSPSGETLVICWAEPVAGGGALYLVAGSHRGVRRLIYLRRELVKLSLYEVVLVLPLLALYGFRVVRPIGRLAESARRYPAVPLADEALLSRGDEIATLARTLSALAADLEARRQQAADLGADIAHEFKNPLASIAASAELLRSTDPLTADRVALVAGAIETSVERLRRSIDDLLALLRLEQAVPGEARTVVAYGTLVEGLASEYRADLRHAGWRFTVEVDPDVGNVALNQRRWIELLRNLVDNARVQPSERREIILAARRTPAGLVTTVRDHGPGISPENQRKIFRRFFSLRPPGVPAGTGLGLSIVQTIAAAHGARVEVRSSPGQGAEFSVVMPV
jgi:signal transduction histidine kinase